MKALVYHGPGQRSWEDVPDPQVRDDTDVVVGVDAVTICGPDLHILKDDVPEVTHGTILGNEAVGTVESQADHASVLFSVVARLLSPPAHICAVSTSL